MTITRHWKKTQTMFFLMAYDQYTSSTKPGRSKMDRKAFSILNTITVVPGEIGFYFSIFLAVDMILAVLAFSAKNHLALAIDMDFS